MTGRVGDAVRRVQERLVGSNDDVLRRLDDLAEQVDYVRHVTEMLRANETMAQRRRKPATPTRVAFLVHLPEAWYSLADVYAAMRDAEDFEPIVVSLPRHLPGSPADVFVGEEFVHERLEAWGIPHLRFTSADSFQDLEVLRMIDPALIFRQSQWDGDVPPGFRTLELRWARLCLVPYEMLHMSTNPPGDASNQTAYDSVFHRNAWLVTCTSAETLEVIREEVPTSQGRQYRVTGHPKADLLRRVAVRPRGDHPFTILWSAHHSIGDDWLKFGTFHKSAHAMLDAARAHPEWNFIYSAHQALLTRMESAEPPLSRTMVDGFLRGWNALPNTTIFGGGDYADVFAEADVLVCDGLSWLIEFQLVNKPVVFIERADHARFNPLGEVTLAGMHRVTSARGALELVTAFAAGEPDAKAAAQREVVQRLFGEEGASARILAGIRTQLELES